METHQRYLIDNGWISEQDGAVRKISVHPVIASVVMDVIKGNEDIAKTVYGNAVESMLLWSNKEDIKQVQYG